MESISPDLLARYNDTLFEFYAAETPAQLIQSLVSHLPRLVAMDTCAFFPVGDDQWQYVDVESPGLDPALFTPYKEYYEQFDLYKEAIFAIAPQPTIDRSSDYMDYMTWATNPHRADFLLPNGMYHLAGIQVFAAHRLIGDLCFYRDVGPDFTDLEMLLLRELQRHICLAFSKMQPLPLPIQSRTPLQSYYLTKKEQEVARLVSLGMTNLHIATHLGVSQNTVKTHLKHLMTKTGSANRAALTRMTCHAVLQDNDR